MNTDFRRPFLFLSVFLLGISAQGQVKKLNDPSIVSHQKRMVFESWGDFRPYPKYILGVQTNFAYATVWGWLAPARNRQYKKGPVIRPLRPAGVEVQRWAELELQRKEAEKIKIQIDTLYRRNIQDFAHWTAATAEADPLWLLYYKRMLKSLKEFPDDPQNFTEWQLKDDKTYQTMLATGGIAHLKKELDLLKDRYHQSRTMDMPRGKRFLMYHETLRDWRKFNDQLRALGHKNALFLEYKKLLTTWNIALGPEQTSNDLQIVQKIMVNYHNKF